MIQLQLKNVNLKKKEKKSHSGKMRDGGLTLDVDGDAGLFAIGDCLVGGLTGDLLARLDVGGG